jgi:hypothetical protein
VSDVVRAEAVGVGGVDEIDARVERRPQRREPRDVIPPGRRRQPHRAEPDGSHRQSSSAFCFAARIRAVMTIPATSATIASIEPPIANTNSRENA